MPILQKNKKSHLERNMFFDNSVDIARYDQVKYPQLEKITDKQLGFFWRPEEVDVSKDKKDFDNLTDHEKHIFTSNLKKANPFRFSSRTSTEPCFPSYMFFTRSRELD